MDRIKTTFRNLADRNEKALVGFVTAGDPSLEISRRIIMAMCQSGIDILELGVPFSDPTADGPVIQRSSERALKNGITLEKVLSLAADVRAVSDIPVVIFSYYNPIFALGADAFFEQAVAAGADGVLVVDLPPEESPELTGGWPDHPFSLIRLIAPTTPDERIGTIAEAASGFIYLVSMTGVTGSGGLDPSLIAEHCQQVRGRTNLPVCVGFGISTAEDVAAVARVAEGVVIGSAFEKTIEENRDNPDLPELLAEQVRSFKAATRS
ncbi:MAG: tryptophan synthase subunit alpha [Desulfosudaceae bacterium]